MSVALVDERFLLSEEQRDALLQWVGRRPGSGPATYAFLSSVAFAALRPQEALGLRVRDVQLSDADEGGLVIPPRRGNGRGGADGTSAVPRVVPACPELAGILKAQIARYDLRADDAVFAGEGGRPLSGAVYRRAWRQAREAVLAEHEIDTPLGRRVSGLRDARITKWLGGYRTAAEVFMVAEWVGVSAPALARRFPHCFRPSGEISYDLMEAALLCP
ncbi:hypothetical protein ACFUJR_12090 [Streptomyces sp. NPDC057271]|uniref:hypothetical protein n=1 Tax=unclassified Streptomyces TaxID=2593676 RepID=UPI00363C83C2